ncbi:glycosyltransferase [Cryobacterium sp. Y62]|uniref:glycosyltransferase n=1 Tax=Cryobacterium sp. Y62 TaxID=2048284 RepID=UPI000CE51CD5|nr:glycosyltransferase [Cryobacterium sp. Y62]
MRIVHVINSLSTGGAETLVVDLATSMRDLGHEVIIIAIGPGRGVPYETAMARELNVRFLGRSPYDVTVLPRLWKALRGADVVHVHLFPSLYLVALASRKAHLLYTEHSTWNRRRDKWIFRIADRYAYRKYTQLTAISEGVRESLLRYMSTLKVESSVAVVANGIGDVFFSSELRMRREANTNFKLIAVGTLDDRKNFGDAIRAVAESPSVQLSIVGDGPQRGHLQDLIESLRVADRIHLLGPSNDVSSLMSTHTALISTSKFEGFSLVAAEAMALGLPVIGPDVPGFNESVLDNITGLLFDQSQGISAIVDAVRKLREKPGLYSELSGNALNHAVTFQIGRAVQSYLTLYEKTILADIDGR